MFFKLQDITVDPSQIVAIERKSSFALVHLHDGVKLQSRVPDDMELEEITQLWTDAKAAAVDAEIAMHRKYYPESEPETKKVSKKRTTKKKEDPEG